MAQTTAFIGNERKGRAYMQRKWLWETQKFRGMDMLV